ncbi:uncharacterized protein DS421_5g166400 [Arachis hypogaea]|nr:uncharacterized protein DS421_5g166400 [Arachis hypogaea]
MRTCDFSPCLNPWPFTLIIEEEACKVETGSTKLATSSPTQRQLRFEQREERGKTETKPTYMYLSQPFLSSSFTLSLDLEFSSKKEF